MIFQQLRHVCIHNASHEASRIVTCVLAASAPYLRSCLSFKKEWGCLLNVAATCFDNPSSLTGAIFFFSLEMMSIPALRGVTRTCQFVLTDVSGQNDLQPSFKVPEKCIHALKEHMSALFERASLKASTFPVARQVHGLAQCEY